MELQECLETKCILCLHIIYNQVYITDAVYSFYQCWLYENISMYVCISSFNLSHAKSKLGFYKLKTK